MHPILFSVHIFGREIAIYSYGVLAAIGIALGWYCALLSARRYKEVSPDILEGFLFVSILAGIAGSHWLYMLQYPYEVDNWMKEFLWIFGSGRVWYGGLFSALLAGGLYLKVKGQSLLRFFDLVSPCIALAHSVGRIGCFFNGCCYGLPSDRLGIYLPALGQKLIPTQLISSVGLLIIFLILLVVRRRYGIGKGKIVGFYMLLYGLFRFGVEFLRYDLVPTYMGLRFSQWLSLGLVTCGIILLLWKRE